MKWDAGQAKFVIDPDLLAWHLEMAGRQVAFSSNGYRWPAQIQGCVDWINGNRLPVENRQRNTSWHVHGTAFIKVVKYVPQDLTERSEFYWELFNDGTREHVAFAAATTAGEFFWEFFEWTKARLVYLDGSPLRVEEVSYSDDDL